MSPLRDILESTCLDHGWKLDAVLNESQRKQTVAARVHLSDGRAAILKAVAPAAPSQSTTDLAAERDFYARSSLPFAPRLIASGPTFICREYVEGKPLRQWLADELPNDDDLAQLVTGLIDGLASGRQQAADSTSVQESTERMIGRIRNLLTSGPASTSRSSLSDSSAKYAARFSRPMLRRAIGRMISRWHDAGVLYQSQLGHNDLHADNVIVTDRGLVVIDFERATSPGYWLVDTLYFLATSCCLLPNSARRDALITAGCAAITKHEPKLASDVGRLFQVFLVAGLSNSRFRVTPWSAALFLELAQSFRRASALLW